MDYEWEPGQTVARYVGASSFGVGKIDRVTRSGRAVIGPNQYAVDGRLIGRGHLSSSRIEPWSEKHDALLKEIRGRVLARSASEFVAGALARHMPEEIIDAVRAALAAKATEPPGASNMKG